MIIQYENVTYDLPKMHTKQILSLFRRLSKGPYCECCHDPEWLEEYAQTTKILLPIIQEELNKREHISNKQEAKEIRKQKAIEQKNQNNRKYRNR